MPRRALRKIDSSLDLASSHLVWEQLPNPWAAAALFGRVAPLEVEIGSGKGLFLGSAATQRTDHDFLGVEVVRKYALAAAARAVKKQAGNVRVLQGDALRLFAELLPDASLAAVHVYFPDPWWKTKHHKRRVMKPSLVRDVERTLAPGGRLHFWTDVEEYFEASLALLAAETKLAGPLEVAERPAADDLDYRTHFERRMRLSGLPVYRSEFVKAAPPNV
jgi:tRNA (guanine-N7-)-methyltransferase